MFFLFVLSLKLLLQINRLREEGLRKIKEQEELLRQRMKEQTVVVEEDEDFLPSLKVTWKAKKNDPSNGGYSLEVLQDIFTKFGVHHILVSRKRNGKAIISFHSALDAHRAIEKACGLQANPLQMVWVSADSSAQASSKTASS